MLTLFLLKAAIIFGSNDGPLGGLVADDTRGHFTMKLVEELNRAMAERSVTQENFGQAFTE